MFEKRLVTTIILTLTVTFLIFRASWPVFLGVASLLAGLAQWEFYKMMDQRGMRPLLFFGLFAGVLLIVIQYVSIRYPSLERAFDLSAMTYFLIFIGAFLVVLSRFGQVEVISCISTTILGVFYVSWLFSFLVKIRFFHGVNGSWFVLFVILVTKSTDIVAYLAGSTLGRRKLLPAISPKKTIEGAVGGMAGAVLVGLLFYVLGAAKMAPLRLGEIIFLSFLFGFFSQLGDIIESALKRDAGLKDSGAWLPGVGGFLDVVDSLLVTAPLMYFYMVQRII